MVDIFDLKTWQIVMKLDCTNMEETQIKSDGDYSFTLRKVSIQQFGYDIEAAVCNSICKKKQPKAIVYTYQVQRKKYPQYDNAKDAFNEISVLIKCSEEEFKQRYGFWQVKNFVVYERDGNQSQCSFQAGDYYYYGKYYTS